jgi:hypothetical protein
MEAVCIFYSHIFYFMVKWYILRPFCTFCAHLVYFSRFGILYRKKSGNPGLVSNCRTRPLVNPSWFRHLSPVLGEVLDPLEGGDELNGDEPLLVALDVLQQELVLRDVRVGKVELHLRHKNFTSETKKARPFLSNKSCLFINETVHVAFKASEVYLANSATGHSNAKYRSGLFSNCSFLFTALLTGMS